MIEQLLQEFSDTRFEEGLLAAGHDGMLDFTPRPSGDVLKQLRAEIASRLKRMERGER